jgi:hypothetical protein
MRKECAIVEERPPDKGRSTNKRRSGKAWSTDEGSSTGDAGPAGKAAAEAGSAHAAHAAEAANVRCTDVTATEAATPTVTTAEPATPTMTAAPTATPSKGRSRNQRGADHGRHDDRDQFFVNHRDPPCVEASPLCVVYQLLSELNTDIPVTRITIADHDFSRRELAAPSTAAHYPKV